MREIVQHEISAVAGADNCGAIVCQRKRRGSSIIWICTPKYPQAGSPEEECVDPHQYTFHDSDMQN